MAIIPFAAGILILEELRKWLARRRLLSASDALARGMN